MIRYFSIAVLTLLIACMGGLSKSSAQSCPNNLTFGVHSSLPSDNNLQAQMEVKWFTTSDPNVFISEREGIARSASFTRMNRRQFLAQVDQLTRQGIASVRKEEDLTTNFGEIAESNLERRNGGDQARLNHASLVSAGPGAVKELERKTEITVHREFGSGYFRVGILSWIVGGGAGGTSRMVDYDASLLMKPGETALIKLRSDGEIKRNGPVRSWVAVTMVGVDGTKRQGSE